MKSSIGTWQKCIVKSIMNALKEKQLLMDIDTCSVCRSCKIPFQSMVDRIQYTADGAVELYLQHILHRCAKDDVCFTIFFLRAHRTLIRNCFDYYSIWNVNYGIERRRWEVLCSAQHLVNEWRVILNIKLCNTLIRHISVLWLMVQPLPSGKRAMTRN